MSTREDLKSWVVAALRFHGGSADILQVCESPWKHHEADLRSSGALFYTSQYDIRWAAQSLREGGVLKPVHGSRSRPWELA